MGILWAHKAAIGCIGLIRNNSISLLAVSPVLNHPSSVKLSEVSFGFLQYLHGEGRGGEGRGGYTSTLRFESVPSSDLNDWARSKLAYSCKHWQKGNLKRLD